MEKQTEEACMTYIHSCMHESLESIAWAVIRRYEELYPDHEVGLMSLPKNDTEGRRRSIDGVIEYLQKEKLDSLG